MENNNRIYWYYKKDKYWWNEYEFNILCSYLFRFGKINKIDIINFKRLEFKEELLISLNTYIKKLLDDLIDDCYEEPTQKMLSKYGPRYEKINYRNKIYRINYRTDSTGIILYSMYHFSIILEQAYTEHESIIVSVV